MMSNKLKTHFWAITLVAATIAPCAVEAAQAIGKLGKSATAIDVYTFSCPLGTAQSRIRVFDQTAVQNSLTTIVATFGKRGSVSATVSDTEATSTSSPLGISGGAGNYIAVVRKIATSSPLGEDDYILETNCMDSTLTTDLGSSALVPQINQ